MMSVDLRRVYGSGWLAKRNLLLCLHLLMSSDLLFRRFILFLNLIISIFSWVHKLQSLVILLNPGVCFKILHLIELFWLFDFKFQMNFDSSVSF